MSVSQTKRWTEAIVPFLNLSPTEPQSPQADVISETQSTWLTLFTHPGDTQKVHPTQFIGPPRELVHMNGWSWLMLYNFPNPHKQAPAGVSEPEATLAKRPQAPH